MPSMHFKLAATAHSFHRPLAICLLLAASLSGGCSLSYDQNFFDFDREQSRTREIYRASYAKAAAEDAALRSGHFDQTATGPQLNGLGRERLDMILSARSPGELLEVWIDVPGDVDEAVAQAMLQVADDYLHTSGLDVSAYVVAVGPAPVQAPTDTVLAASGAGATSPAAAAPAPAPGIFSSAQ